MTETGTIVCRLSFREGDANRTVDVGDAAFSIGRASDCDLVLRDESVSRLHARIEYAVADGGGWSICDVGSKNGVRVNTYRTPRQILADGDRIDLGAVRLHVEIRPASQAAEARVVFAPEESRGFRTEVIDMDRLGSILGGGTAESPPGRASAARHALDPAASGETGGLLPLFGEAAEALISCDSLDETLERILALVFNNLPAERGVICLYDEETETTVPKVMRTRDGIPDEPIAISSNIARDVIMRKQSLLVQGAAMDDRFGGADSVILMNIKSAMCAPLYRLGRVVGFVYVDRQTGHLPFSATHLQTLSTLAVLSAVAVEQAALRDSLRHEQEMRARLSRYSSPAVVERILQEPGIAERGMVADEGEVTVLFADLSGFTPLAERLEPTEVVHTLNQVLERLCEVVFEFEGTLDKFRGDGIMAFFGAPLPMPDHADRAVGAALRMQEILGEVNTYTDSDRALDMRIGINSGPVVVGDIGSPQRKDYTVIGDVVNTASRLESSVARPGQVVIGEATRERLTARFRCTPLEEVTLRGKSRSVKPSLVVGVDDRLEL